MASNIQLKRRIAGAVGAPAALAEGELAYNNMGYGPVDQANGGALWIGDGTNVQKLVSASRQVELDGDQEVRDLKVFSGTFSIGSIPGTNDYPFPAARGAAGQILQMNTGATALEFANAAAVVILDNPIPGAAVIEDDFNAVTDWSTTGGDQTTVPFTVNAGEMWVLNHNGAAYMWGGGTGTYGTGAGGTAAVNGDFIPLGAATGFATAAEVQAGTVTNKAIAPDVAASDLFRTHDLSGDQTVDVRATFMKNVSFAGNLTGFYHSNTVIEVPNGGTLRGGDLTAPNILTIDNAVIDGGTF